jgi:hypothetical protein
MSSGGCNEEDSPLAGHALEHVFASIIELDPRACHQILHGGGREHLSRSGKGRCAGLDVDRDPADVISGEFDLPGMQSATHLESEGPNPLGDRVGAADGPSGSVEGCQESVAHSVHFPAPEAVQLPPDQGIVIFQEATPLAVAELGSPLRGADDVREQDSGKHSVGLRAVANPGQELLHLIKDGILVADVGQVIAA